MSELERLDEAIEDVEYTLGKASKWGYSAGESLEVIRAYRDLLANGHRVEWCEAHKSVRYSAGDDGRCNAAIVEGEFHDCSFVSRLLVDPPKERE